jgi:hypothetical protein
LRFEGRKRVHNANEIMSEIVAKRLVEHLARAGVVVMKRPPTIGGTALGRGFEDDRADGAAIAAAIVTRVETMIEGALRLPTSSAGTDGRAQHMPPDSYNL